MAKRLPPINLPPWRILLLVSGQPFQNPLERNFVQRGLSEWLPFSSIVGKQCDFEEIIFEENRGMRLFENPLSHHDQKEDKK